MSFTKVAIHGVPRAGTSWLGAIFDSSFNVKYNNQPLFAYEFKSYLNDSSSNRKIDTFFNLLCDTKDDFINQTSQKKNGLIPSFEKKSITHIVYKEARYHHIIENLLIQDPDIIVVGIIRNPKSVMHSWFNAPKEFDKENWDFSTEWLNAHKKNQNRPEEFYGYLKWKEFGLNLLKLKDQFPSRVCIVNYKMLLNNTQLEVKRIFNFCNIEYGSQTENFIVGKGISANDNPYSVFRKSQTDDKWVKDLSKEIIDYIDQDLKESILMEYNI
jgi:hypothetical protein